MRRRRREPVWEDAAVLGRLREETTEETGFALDGERRLVYLSPQARALLGSAAARAAARPFETLVPEADRPRVARWLERLPPRAGAVLEHPMLRADGGLLWVRTVARRARVAGAPEVRIWGSCRDLTAHKQFEVTVERVAQQWRATVDATADAIFMLGPDARVVRLNRAAARLCGLEYAALLGREIGELLATTLGVRHALGVPAALAGGGPQEVDLFVARRRRWLRAQATDLRAAGESVVGAVLVLSDISARKAAEASLQRSHEQLRTLSRRAEEISERNRSELAREIHDELGHLLTALKMDLAWIDGKLPPGSAAVHERVQAALAVSVEAIASVRRISAELHPSVLDALGLPEAIAWHCRELQKRTGLDVEVVLPREEVTLGRAAATALFRIVQEATTNVVRHAAASRLAVRLEVERDELLLRVEDDGRGFSRRGLDARRGFGLGLLGMRERGDMIAAEVTVRSRPGRGTTVTVRRRLER